MIIQLYSKSTYQHPWRWRTNLVIMFDSGNSFGFVPVSQKDDLSEAFIFAAKLLQKCNLPPPSTFA